MEQKTSRREESKKIKMTTRTILGSIQNVSQARPSQQGGKILQVANWLTGKAGNNVASGKENIVQKLDKQAQKQHGVRRNNKRHCVETNQPMEIDVVPEKIAKTVIKTLPEGVIDIDKEETDVNACAEYARDIYAYLRTLEMANPVRENYLEGHDITSKMRSLLVDWIVSVHQQFELAQETLFLAINILDRYLQEEVERTSRDDLQLVGVTALLLACKMEEIYLPSVDDFVYSTDNAYTDAEIRTMEVHMLATLRFDLSSPISLSFLRRYSKAGDVDVLEHTLAKYILELSLLDFGQVALPPSLAAAAALNLSLRLLEPELAEPWNASLQYHSGLTSGLLTSISRRMAVVLTNCQSHKLQAVRQKYSSRKYRRVALIKELGPEFIKKQVKLG